MTELYNLLFFLAFLLLAPPPAFAGPDDSESPSTHWSENAGAQAVGVSNAESSVEVITLSRALAFALAGNPDLEEFSWDVRASEARLLQAELLPNPTFEFVLEDFAGSGDFTSTDQAQATLLLSQLLELGGKRSARSQVASHASELANWSYRIKRVEVLSDTTIAFIHVAADQEKLRLAREATKLAKTTLQNIVARVKAGKSSTLQEMNARVALAQLDIEQERAEHELKAAKLRLAAMWGAQNALFNRVDVDLFSRQPIPTYDELSDRLRSSPEIQRWMSEQQIWAAETRLARANRIPDVTLDIGLRRYEGPDDGALVVQISVPLPVFNRNQGRIEETIALQRKSKAGKRSAEVRHNKLLFGMYQEVHQAEIEMEKSKTKILPHAEEALRIAREGFQQGRFSYLELSDAQSTFVEARKRYIDLATEFYQFKVEVERLIGEPLHNEVRQISEEE